MLADLSVGPGGEAGAVEGVGARSAPHVGSTDLGGCGIHDGLARTEIGGAERNVGSGSGLSLEAGDVLSNTGDGGEVRDVFEACNLEADVGVRNNDLCGLCGLGQRCGSAEGDGGCDSGATHHVVIATAMLSHE